MARRSGNVADAHGDMVAGLLDALEKMDNAFDDDGNLALQMILSQSAPHASGRSYGLSPQWSFW